MPTPAVDGVFDGGPPSNVARYRCWIYVLFAATLSAGPAAVADTHSGENIFQTGGIGESPAIEATLASGNVRFPATGFACASCHGIDGAGKREGAGQVPPITWAALSIPRSGSAELPARSAYNDRSLERAITDGIDAGDRALSAAMPRYALSTAQTTALIAYLRKLGRADAGEEGVSPIRIRVGAALPLSGLRAAMGLSIKRLLTAAFARASATGIYGRRLELVTADTAPGGANAALRQLVKSQHAFALVATQAPTDGASFDPDIPVLGVLDGAETLPSPRVFRIGSPIDDRVAALLRQAQLSEGPNLPLAVIGRADAPGRAALNGSSPGSMRVVLDWHDLAAPGAAIASAQAAGAKAILLLAPRAAVAAFGGALTTAGATLPLLIPGDRYEDVASEADPPFFSSDLTHVRLAFAGLAQGQIDESEFDKIVVSAAGAPERSLAAYEAYASAAAFLEALKQIGRRLDRASLVDALERLRDVHTGVLPPITFSADRHEGLSGGAVIGFMADGHAKFLSPWQPAPHRSY